MTHLDDMALFVEVVKAKGFRGAADALGMPNSTLSRRIGALEKAIGLRLLHRTTRKVEPTEAGLLYYERSKRIVEEARLVHEQLGEMLAQPSGLLRASFPEGFANIFLAPLVAEFARRYPGIRFEFDLSPRLADLVSDPVDVAIRMGEPANSNLIARQLARLPRHLYASPRYLDMLGEPRHPDELVQHECLRLRGSKSDIWTVQNRDETVDVAVGGRFLLNSVGMIQRLAALDMGIAILAESIVTDDVAQGRLRRVLPQWEATPVPVYALTETRLLPAKTQRFIDFLREHLSSI
ncbi:LysR family transcriptional regulator [Burkholderia ambifaria]|uniref:LysR family transcriptional regulator n=1 Tax=Burkholderia ambifaria TaxID=152480 RepID=UPI00158F21FD|nr:LysR family transcriptional regulator [Burkholderia ambifaria]MDP9580792.1 DNA-binding transcriptional LysR family regulator [Burkholderia contaminans]WDR87615.1 LysR family transcriptional regulator [Burkholderia ambifaria]WDS00324.1 LysR family transcriptional regulator [Burkholderia ambifaria]